MGSSATESRPLHVLVAGGGLAGLALAQGLLKGGHTVEIFERDGDFSRKQGYRLSINALGGEALRRVLPDDLFELYMETSHRAGKRREAIVINPQFEEVSSRPQIGPPNDGPRPHTAVHRMTLRQILASRLGGRLRLGKAVVSFEQDGNGVTAVLTDGSTTRGDLLVGADGIRSAVRSQLLPGASVVPTGVRGIGVYGRTPLTAGLEALLPDVVNDGTLMAVDDRRSRLLISMFRPRRAADEAAADIAPDVRLDPVPPYVMISCSVAAGTVIPPRAEWTDKTALELRKSMLSTVQDWHPAAGALVGGLDPGSIFAIPFGYLEPAQAWEPSRVTIVGDAAHGMLPTLGMGANLSLNDAAVLAGQVGRYAAGEAGLLDAVASYEAIMRDTSYPILRMSLDHDTNFGGGGLARAAGGSGGG
jgi:2-polyprenyl-6-methoxyphenol hydroxylase-like FAD-dependent oxidoreductase